MNKLTPLVKGIITGILMVIIRLFVYYKIIPEGLYFLNYIIFAAGITWTLISYSRSASFTGSFADLFGQGFRCFIVAALVMVAFISIFNILHPELAMEAAASAREAMVKEGGKTPAEIDKLVDQLKKRYNTLEIYFTVFGYLILGPIVTAAGSAFLMRRK